MKDIYHNTHPTARIVSRNLIDRIHFRFLSGMEEGIYFELMIHANHISTVPEQLYFYRSRNGSLSTTPNPKVNQNSMLNNITLGKRNPNYSEYFAFKAIEDLLQMTANSIKIGDKKAYSEAVSLLRSLHYLKNPYLSTFYKKNFAISPLHNKGISIAI